MGRYDIVFLIRILLGANTDLGKEKYILSIISKDDVIVCMNIQVGPNTVKLVDSYNILSHSLYKLGETFNLDIKKDIFPYTFVNKETMFYLGKKPYISFYNSNVDKIEYDLIPNYDWSTKIETLKYLDKDLTCLFEVINKFSDYIYRKHKVQVSGSLTISSLAMKIFLTRFYKNNVPLINKRSIYDDIKKSYFGGITEVYKPYGENLYYYDVNYLYPYAALNDMPGLDCIFNDSINSSIEDIDSFFSFYYC